MIKGFPISMIVDALAEWLIPAMIAEAEQMAETDPMLTAECECDGLGDACPACRSKSDPDADLPF